MFTTFPCLAVVTRHHSTSLDKSKKIRKEMEAVGTMDVALCRVEPDPVFLYPIPNATHPATAKFSITSTARHKIAYKIRGAIQYALKHHENHQKFGCKGHFKITLNDLRNMIFKWKDQITVSTKIMIFICLGRPFDLDLARSDES